jgi:hypothetical protein
VYPEQSGRGQVSCSSTRGQTDGRTRLKPTQSGIEPAIPPSGTGCVECLASDGWWLHLRRCAECGHIGCCDSSPNQHATKHFDATGHPIVASFEPGETWFYNYATGKMLRGEILAPPRWHPENQPVPGPAGRVPADWESVASNQPQATLMCIRPPAHSQRPGVS